MLQQLPVKQRVRPALLALAVAVLIVMVGAFTVQIGLVKIRALADARVQAQNGRLTLEHAMSLIKDLETGSRGFALTGDAEYLLPNESARKALPSVYREVKASSDKYGSPSWWAELDVLVAHRVALSEQLVVERRIRGAGVLGDLDLLNAGRRTMEGIRDRFVLLDAHQAAVIADINTQLRGTRERTVALAWVSSFSTVALMVLSTLLLLRERQARRRLEDELNTVNLQLEARIAERTRELAEALEHVSGFTAELNRGIESERRRLAREVHDQIGQVFTGIKMIFRGLAPETLPKEQEAMLLSALEMGIVTTRRISSELRPPLLDDMGLEEALKHLLATVFTATDIQTAVSLRQYAVLDEAQAMGIFRIVQEASTNVIRYAAARNFSLQGYPVDGVYEVTLLDDGVGMDPGKSRPGALGLVGMRERAELMGASLDMDSEEGSGTRIILRIPLKAP